MGFSIFQKCFGPDGVLLKTPIGNRFSTDLSASHKVDKLEKRFLVWTGKYKTVEEVPAFVGQHVMERARNRMRIKIANYMIAATIIGCGVMIYLGKQDAKAGISLQKQNLEWHRKIKEEDEKAKALATQKEN